MSISVYLYTCTYGIHTSVYLYTCVYSINTSVYLYICVHGIITSVYLYICVCGYLRRERLLLISSFSRQLSWWKREREWEGRGREGSGWVGEGGRDQNGWAWWREFIGKICDSFEFAVRDSFIRSNRIGVWWQKKDDKCDKSIYVQFVTHLFVTDSYDQTKLGFSWQEKDDKSVNVSS